MKNEEMNVGKLNERSKDGKDGKDERNLPTPLFARKTGFNFLSTSPKCGTTMCGRTSN